jgi:hypothetical protein
VPDAAVELKDNAKGVNTINENRSRRGIPGFQVQRSSRRDMLIAGQHSVFRINGNNVAAQSRPVNSLTNRTLSDVRGKNVWDQSAAAEAAIFSPKRWRISLSQVLGLVPWITRPKNPRRSPTLSRLCRTCSLLILVYRAGKLSILLGLAKN